MSRFDTAMICLACDDLERAHPAWAAAVRLDCEAIRRGDYNYPGPGLPAGFIVPNEEKQP